MSGNRILHDHPEDLFGPSALARLDRDVLSVPGLRWVVLMEGINDIGHPTAGRGVDDHRVAAHFGREHRDRALEVVEVGARAADQEQQAGVG